MQVAARTSQLGLTSDPYAVLSVGVSAATSAVVCNELSTQWAEQKFVLFVKDMATDTLKVRPACGLSLTWTHTS
jgi:hypothetical protein